MIFLDWNMGWGASIDKAIAGIKAIIEKDSFIITLQEIGEKKGKNLIDEFSQCCNIEYSMVYRPRGKREPGNRELGIMIITSKDVLIKNAQVLSNALLPERTLLVDVKIQNRIVRILSLHSITGCDHKRAKSLQFYAFADAIDMYRPDIVSFDANEPETDAPSIADMKFFDNKDHGYGAKEFFSSLKENGLSDSFLHSFSGQWDGKAPLAVSHIVKGKGPARYDFIFVNEDIIDVIDVEYRLQEAQTATGDHAFVVMCFEIREDKNN